MRGQEQRHQGEENQEGKNMRKMDRDVGGNEGPASNKAYKAV